MKTKYYVNQTGQYIGSSDDPIPPVDGIEVPTFPNDAIKERWNGTEFVEVVLKEQALLKITVTTQSGKTFDGNDTAIVRMASAIMIAERTGQTASEWRMADNSKVEITLDELKEAQTLAMQRLGEIVLQE